ncbi:cell division protein ZapA [Balneicella halophila]|uniref:Cell division protein ZapA n=1 Tax=Balneicella halophila TaxID=1537566 RepID=A0A7L4UP03_BALHA|nr:cell division protein ZapA [Balneicella halophila]PVX50841.1 cell division protein ZapA [Balneicella halophila]
MEKKISINLYIAEHHFPLTVTTEEEEVLRKAAKLLNDKIRTWQNETKHSTLSQEKIMAGVALEVVGSLIKENKIQDKDSIENDLEEIRIMLEDSIINN